MYESPEPINGSTKYKFLVHLTPKESLESQQNHALRNGFLRSQLCSNDNFNPGYNRKLERERSFLMEIVLIMNGCFFQNNAPRVEYVNVAQKINSCCQE